MLPPPMKPIAYLVSRRSDLVRPADREAFERF
jgi:hypothetical protein